MNKLILLGIAATLGVVSYALFPANPPVDLQPTSPGTAQSGHLSISGTATVGLLKSQGTVFGQSTAQTGFAYGGFFTAASNQGRGFYGFASATSGLTYGGFFQNASDSGRAVFGLATATNGFNYGGYFQTASDNGRGVLGVAASPTGITYGVFGTAVSPSGFGVYSNGNMHATGVISGNGSGLSNLSASAITAGTLSALRLPVPLELTGSSGAAILSAVNTYVGPTAYGVYGQSDATQNGRGVFGYASATSGTNYGVRGESKSTGGYGIYGSASAASGGSIGVFGSSQSPDGRGVSGTNSSTTGLARGGFFTSASSAGEGLVGWAYSMTGSTYGIHGIADSAGGIGVFGESAGTYGVYGLSTAAGYNYGVRGLSTSPFGTGVSGEASSTTGVTTGVRGFAASSQGRAVFGEATATSGVTYGGFFTASSPLGYGIYAGSEGIYGVRAESNVVSVVSYGGYFESKSPTGRGVYGYNSSATGTSYGVRGSTASGAGFGVYSNGDFGASGTKAFRIDHPADPENKYLLHYSTESPFPQNSYSGTVTTDAQGKAWVQLPDYFEEINTNFKYQLTVVRDDEVPSFVQAQIGRKIIGGKFLIMTSSPRTEVSWEIKADRNDRFVRRYVPKDVIDKQGEEIGKYQRPELYDLGADRGMDFDPAKDRSPQVHPNSEPAQGKKNRK